jgi:hypothetical protein
MKKVLRLLYTFALIVCLGFLMISAEYNSPEPSEHAAKLKKHHCFGYTIIEAGKGVDCYGDTVKLVKSHGYYQLASSVRTDHRVGFKFP